MGLIGCSKAMRLPALAARLLRPSGVQHRITPATAWRSRKPPPRCSANQPGAALRVLMAVEAEAADCAARPSSARRWDVRDALTSDRARRPRSATDEVTDGRPAVGFPLRRQCRAAPAPHVNTAEGLATPPSVVTRAAPGDRSGLAQVDLAMRRVKRCQQVRRRCVRQRAADPPSQDRWSDETH